MQLDNYIRAIGEIVGRRVRLKPECHIGVQVRILHGAQGTVPHPPDEGVGSVQPTGGVAQQEEQRSPKPPVAGSTPVAPAFVFARR